MAPCAVAWLAEASPKLAITSASRGITAWSGARRGAWATDQAAPTALGRWLAMVEVCGGISSRRAPSTLCRPPEIGSSAEAASDSAMSRTGSPPPTCAARASWNAASR